MPKYDESAFFSADSPRPRLLLLCVVPAARRLRYVPAAAWGPRFLLAAGCSQRQGPARRFRSRSAGGRPQIWAQLTP